MESVPHRPKYQEIIDAVRARIASGELVPGDKLPVRDELARAYQVTRTTIDRALGDLIREGDLVASRRNGTFVAARLLDKAAVITWKPLRRTYGVRRGKHAFESMFERIFDDLAPGRCEAITPQQALKNPELLRRYRRILWSSTSREEFEKAAAVIGDPARVLLLNREYPGFDFVSTDQRQAARELTALFLRNLPSRVTPLFIDMPDAHDLSGRDLWLTRCQGFIDACEEFHRFYRIVEFHQEDFYGNLEQLRQFVGPCTPETPGLIISPTKATIGCVLGFLYAIEGRLGRDCFYGDFDNPNSLFDYGLPIPSVVQDFEAIGELAASNFTAAEVRFHVPHVILNSPWK